MLDDDIRYKKDLLRWAKRRANKQGVPFTITLGDIKIPEKCPVLGCKLVRGSKIKNPTSPSIDRVVPQLGYVPGNILVISMRANLIKSDATWHELKLVTAFYEQYIAKEWMQ